MQIPTNTFLDLRFKMHIRSWSPSPTNSAKVPFLLIHGLSSNAQTWDAIGRLLAAAGHPAVAIDQRNHGLSQKTQTGFDFETITADVYAALEHLEWKKPILVGQSWGGNVLTEFGARYPGRCAGLVMVDGGFLDFRSTGSTWDTISKRLTPPDVDRFPAETMRYFIQSSHPDWSDEGIDGTMANFKINSEDDSIQRRLEVSKHVQILRHLFDQPVQALFQQIGEPVLICASGKDDTPEPEKEKWLDQARIIKQHTIKWFSQTDHDIHVHKPQELVETIFAWMKIENV